MRILTSVFSILALTFALGCGGGDDDDDDGANVDASTGDIDGGNTGPDAMPSNVADGQACTASQEDPQGGCPATHACVNSTCSQLCDLGADGNPTQAVCPGYTGPGSSLCIAGLSATGQPPFAAAACGVVCGDTTGNVPGCMAGECDGSCPGTWTCTADAAGAGIDVCQ